jgi:hypothetical protein
VELHALYSRLGYEDEYDKVRAKIKIMTPQGDRFDILSLNWDEDMHEWVIIGEGDE